MLITSSIFSSQQTSLWPSGLGWLSVNYQRLNALKKQEYLEVRWDTTTPYWRAAQYLGQITRSRSFQGQSINYSLLDLSFFSPVSLDCAAISWHKCLPYQPLTHLLTSELVTRLQVFLQWGLISFKTDHWTEKSKSTSVTWGRLHLHLTYYQPSATCVETPQGHKSLRNQTSLVFLVLVSLQ